ncbi:MULTISPECIES: DUF6084 family protein [Streptomyces]|uniref:DUF6084 family protein n=1 Tax=Streptomyces luteosporeus TaxID=173856 RepID=A0ABN3U1B4_9ACTN
MSAPTAPGCAPGPARREDIAELSFAVTGCRPLEHAAVPTLAFRLSLTRTGGGPVRSVALTTDVRIAPARRRPADGERLALARLFGRPEQWATSMRPLSWARLTTFVPPFDARTVLELPVPCTRECELAVTAYFEAVRDGEVPLEFHFSGTVFHTGDDGRLRTSQISWNGEAVHRLPARQWHELTGRYFGGQSWLRVSRETHDLLAAHRDRRALAGWDETVRDLVEGTAG